MNLWEIWEIWERLGKFAGNLQKICGESAYLRNLRETNKGAAATAVNISGG